MIWLCEADYPPAMWGSATLAIVPSRVCMTVASMIETVIISRWGRNGGLGRKFNCDDKEWKPSNSNVRYYLTEKLGLPKSSQKQKVDFAGKRATLYSTARNSLRTNASNPASSAASNVANMLVNCMRRCGR